jgi:hypothetical protein
MLGAAITLAFAAIAWLFVQVARDGIELDEFLRLC